MPRLVKGPDGKIQSFPDDATDMEISAALEAHPAKPAKTWTDTAVDALPAIGGAVGGIVGGIGGTVAGLGVGGVPGAIGGAAVGGGAGEAARQLMNRWRGTDAPQSAGAAAAGIATEGAIQGGMEAAGGLVAKGAKTLGTAVYRGYLKPSLAGTEIAKAREIVETGIANALPITKGGEARAARLIGQINGQVEAALKGSSETVDLTAIANRVRAFAKKTYYRPGVPMQDFEAAMKVADEIDKHPSLGLPGGVTPSRVDVPVVQGNQVKQGLDKAIGDTGFGVERTAPTEARKIGRYAAREAIEHKVPGVGPLNAKESKLIDAMDAIQKAAAREENKNPLTGWSSTILAGGVGGASYAHNGDPTAAVLTAMVARGVVTPAVASQAAIYAAKFGNSKAAPHVVANALRMGLVMASRAAGKSDE